LQIPALIISTAAGTVVTRNHSKNNIGDDIANQLLFNSRAVYVASGIIFFLGIIPGLPTLPFGMIAFLLAGIGWTISRYDQEEKQEAAQKKVEEAAKPKKPNLENLLPLDMVEFQVGFGLVSTVESEETGDLLDRIMSLRKQIAIDLGIIVPSIHIRDIMGFKGGEYQIKIKGEVVAKGELKPECLLAIDTGDVAEAIDGVPTKDPAFGQEALWITKMQREHAEMQGYVVVELSTVLATHLNEVLRNHAFEIFGRQEAHRLIENFKKTNPKVVEELIPEILTLGQVVNVLQNLLKEQVSIRDLLTIFETLADVGPKTKDVDHLTENVRRSLARNISHSLSSGNKSIKVFGLHGAIEELIAGSLLQTDDGIQIAMDPVYKKGLIEAIQNKILSNPQLEAQPVLLTTAGSRRPLYRLISRYIPQLAILSHSEISSDLSVETVDIVEEISAS